MYGTFIIKMKNGVTLISKTMNTDEPRLNQLITLKSPPEYKNVVIYPDIGTSLQTINIKTAKIVKIKRAIKKGQYTFIGECVEI